jgi:hypothetical protein
MKISINLLFFFVFFPDPGRKMGAKQKVWGREKTLENVLLEVSHSKT